MGNQQTLSHYLLKHLEDSEIQSELVSIITDIATAGKKISHEVQRSGLLDLHGAHGGQNVHDEEVQKLDDRSNEIVKSILSSNEHIIGLASEEESDIVDTSNGKLAGFIVAFDPLDGSSNIDINASVGSIFSVLPSWSDIRKDFLQPGRSQLASIYVLYGSSTVLVLTTGSGVHEFTLDPDNGEFILTMENIRIPESSKYVSYNEGNRSKFRGSEAQAIKKLVKDIGSARYMGALVADLHRTLIKGGIFLYPAVKKGDGYVGKLRMQYEVKPMAQIIVEAGGMALINNEDATSVAPDELHEKVPFVFGDSKTVKKYQSYRYDKK
ncbi:fructose-1,6-bisphosphatase [Candidatus Saccharibacteria bacterium]|nr:fructose-1,6-bisphosphatase [Candidatus Saccharibacteria bacterium]